MEVDDVDIETDESGNPEELIKRLRGKIEACEKEKREYLDGWQRSKADFVNARREEEQSRSSIRKYAKADLITEILPIADNFERAMANAEAWHKVDENWRKGIEYIYSQLQQVLENHEVKPIGMPGERFDARLHQPVEAVSTDDPNEDDIIFSVLEKGYSLHEHIVRPAKVTVAHYSGKGGGQAQE